MKVLVELFRTFLERKGAPKNFKSGLTLIRVSKESFDQTFSKVCGVQGQSPCKTAFLFLQSLFFFAPRAVKEKKRQMVKVNVCQLIYA